MNITEKVKAAGVVGAGGAGFPTHVKLNAKADCFIVNAAECEPLIETDKFLCRTYADKIIEGTLLVSTHLEAKRAVIVIKRKYQEEIKCLKEAITKAAADIEIFEMKTFYPAGDEQVIVQQVCNQSVPERGIPIDVGAVVNNVGTILNIVDALNGIPVTYKYLSVVGEVEKPIMLNVPIGTSISECIAKAKVKIPNYVVILGGPMMGKILDNQEAIDKEFVTKTTGNILILPPNHYLITRNKVSFKRISQQAQSACIGCRMCTDLCPRYLIGHKVRPHMVMRNIWRENIILDNNKYKEIFSDAISCCECGVCELFACPMGLSPCRVNIFIKKQLKERGIQVERNMKPEARESVDIHKTPTERLVARLGLSSYDGLHAHECYEIKPSEVFIPFSQHIGMPALPIVRVGDKVNVGDLIAAANTEGLSTNIHSSIEGFVTEITNGGARISLKEG
jgi:Na+-translocating ferredoxin:NAD+ oxidoreductase RnfC subunit